MKRFSPLSISALAVLTLAHLASGALFTVEPGTPDVGAGVPPANDILLPGTTVLPPTPLLTGGLAVGDNVDAISFNSPIGTSWQFSVDAAAAGLAGTAVEAQALAGEAIRDIFATGLAGSNTLAFDGNGVGPAPPGPPLGLAEPPLTPPFGINGIASDPAGGGISWSVDATTVLGVPVYSGPGFSEADVFLGPPADGFAGAPAVWATELDLGLTTGGNDLDALHVVDVGAVGVWDAGDAVYFSLATGSGSLAAVTGDFGPLGAGPGDILLTTFGAPPSVFASATDLGIAAGANITGLTAVPEAGETSVLALAALGVALHRRRKRRA